MFRFCKPVAFVEGEERPPPAVKTPPPLLWKSLVEFFLVPVWLAIFLPLKFREPMEVTGFAVDCCVTFGLEIRRRCAEDLELICPVENASTLSTAR